MAEIIAVVKELEESASKAGNAKDQSEYELWYDRYFDILDQLDALLGNQKYLLGNVLGEADGRLYDQLVRWDVVEFFAYRLNRNRLRDFTHLWRYAREIYQHAGGRERTDFEKIKRDYYGNLNEIRNPYHIIPLGPDVSIWES